MFTSAKQAEVIRSNQKDEYYVSYIKSSVADIIQRFFGPRAWLTWRKELDFIGDLGYFGLTTLAGYQTLGEEYVNIVQVDDTLRTVPSGLRRALMILLQVSAPYALDRSLSYIERRVRLDLSGTLTPDAKRAILGAIPVIRHTITLLHRCHLALFYMSGVFYHISKRLTSTHYILVRDSGSSVSGSNYRILGWLSVAQLTLAFIRQMYQWSKTRKNAEKPRVQAGGILGTVSESAQNKIVRSGDTEGASDPQLKCALCLEVRSNTTTTPCGHLFCWNCITEWCATKPECPLCRESFQMSRLVCLRNYDPS